jgi:hypothetical protein
MSQESNNGAQPNNLLSGIASGVIEKAWDFNWCLKAIYVMLFSDVCLMFMTGDGLYNLSFSTDAIWKNFGKLACVVLAFLMYASLLVPMLTHVVKVIFGSDSRASDSQAPIDYVRTSELRRLAVSEQSNFLLSLCDQNRDAIEDLRVKKYQICSMLLGLLVLIAADYACGALKGAQSLISFVDTIFGWWGMGAIVLAILYALQWALMEGSGRAWVYYPLLYEEKLRKEQADKKNAEAARRKYMEQQEMTGNIRPK